MSNIDLPIFTKIIEDDEDEKYDYYFNLFNSYLIESFEVFILFVFFKVVTDKPLELKLVIRTSLIMGVVITVIGLYNAEIKRSLKLGIMGSVGSKMIS